MGPCLWGTEYAGQCFQDSPNEKRFNGAVPLGHGIRFLFQWNGLAWNGFNGAVPLGHGIRHVRRRSTCVFDSLQWGRAFGARNTARVSIVEIAGGCEPFFEGLRNLSAENSILLMHSLHVVAGTVVNSCERSWGSARHWTSRIVINLNFISPRCQRSSPPSDFTASSFKPEAA